MSDMMRAAQLLEVRARKCEEYVFNVENKSMVWLRETEEKARRMFSRPEPIPNIPEIQERESRQQSLRSRNARKIAISNERHDAEQPCLPRVTRQMAKSLKYKGHSCTDGVEDDLTKARRKGCKRAVESLYDVSYEQCADDAGHSLPRKKTASPPCPPNKVLRPPAANMRTFLQTVQENKMLMSAPGPSTSKVNFKSFIQRTTPLKSDIKKLHVALVELPGEVQRLTLHLQEQQETLAKGRRTKEEQEEEQGRRDEKAKEEQEKPALDVIEVPKSPANQSYEMTLQNSNPETAKICGDNYGMDLNSDDSTDDESEPKKPIPSWASGKLLHDAMHRQFYNPIDVDRTLGGIEPPNLEEIFDKSKRRYVKRTSSADWHSLPLEQLKK